MGAGAKPIEVGAKASGKGGGGGDPIVTRALKGVMRNSGVRGVLNTLDAPRAVLASGAHQLVNGKWDNAEFLRDARSHKGFGSYIQDAHPDMPQWAKIAAGFAGDVALDPLTYVSFGATSAVEGAARTGAKMGWKDVAERLSVAAGRESNPAVKKALEESVAKVTARRSAGAADKALLAREGIETGGSIGAFGHRVKLPLGDSIVAGKAATTGKTIAGVAGSKPGTWVRKRFMGGEFVDQLATNPAAAFRAKAANRTAQQVAAGLSDDLKVELNGIYKRYPELRGEAASHLSNVIENAQAIRKVPVELRPQVRAAAREYKDWLELAVGRGEKLAGIQVNRLPDYLPHQLNELGKEMAKATRMGGKEGFQRQRKLEGTLAELMAKGQEQFGKDFQEVWTTDPWEIGKRYADSVGRSVSANAPITQLRNWGDVVTAFPKVEGRITSSAKKATRLARKATKSTAEADALRAALGIDPAELTAARAGADAAKTEARQAAEQVGTLEAEKAGLAAATPVAPEVPVVPQEALDALGKAKATLAGHETALEGLSAPPAAAVADPRVAIAQEAVKIKKQLDHLDRVMIGEFPPSSLGEGWTTPKVEAARKELRARHAELEQAFKAAPTEAAAPKGVDKARKALETKITKAKAEITKAQVAVDAATAAKPENFGAAVEANAERLAQIDTELATAKGILADRLAAEKAHRQLATDLAQRAQAEVEPTMQEIARLESVAAQAAADAEQQAKRGAKAGERLLELNPDVRKEELEKLIKSGFKELVNRPGHYAPEQVAEHLAEMLRWEADYGTEKFWKVFDSIQGRWKAYSLLSPGFHVRNFMGGVFNNSLAGVDLRLYSTVGKGYAQYLHGGIEAVSDAQVKATFQRMMDFGMMSDTLGRDFADIGSAATLRKGGFEYAAERMGLSADASRTIGMADPTSLDFVPLHLNTRVGESVEHVLRGVMFHDSLLQGLSPEEALARVFKYHFNYADLAPWERKYMKRAVPFYTWARKNLPLQLEHIATDPGKYTRYQHVKDSVESQSGEDPVVPSYFNEMMAMRWFRKTKGGDSVYLAPDLPYIGLEETVNPRQLLSSVSPVFKTPLQSMTGVNLYTGAPMSTKQTPVPSTWKWMMPVLSQLSGLPGVPRVNKDSNGQYVMSAREAQKVEDFLPILGRTRRLLPSEPKYQQRAFTSSLSFLFGINSRTLDGETINGELARRARR